MEFLLFLIRRILLAKDIHDPLLHGELSPDPGPGLCPGPRSRSRSWSRPRHRSRSRSRGRSRSRSPGRGAVVNPGNTLYVTGLSQRVSEKDVERHFSKEGKSVLEGRYITVERSRRKRPRTPTPGHYLGLKNTRDVRGDRDRDRDRDRGRYRGGSGRDDYGYRRSPRRSPYRGGRDYSPRSSPYGGGRSRRERSYSPYGSPERNSKPPILQDFLSLPTPSLCFKLSPPTTLKFSTKLHTLSPSFNSSYTDHFQEDHVIGDCVVFEEGVFDDPYLQNDAEIERFAPDKPKPRKGADEIVTENLVPEPWREVQAEVNITKKERRKIAQELQFGSRVEKNKKGLEPIRNLNLEEYVAFREAKLNQLKPLVLDQPEKFAEEDDKESEGNDGFVSERVAPKNPRWAVYGKGLEDVTEFFNSGHYEPGVKKSQGPRPLFTKEEKLLLNRRKPDIAAATSVSITSVMTMNS
ncbi:hypothetical protein M0R45_003909 [Rubus argutus]|uniref:Uncharacterized protein n=1 Tax=Rubus argutus TaxID=59490 RepID=A0AAW1YIQ3_RUBAR